MTKAVVDQLVANMKKAGIVTKATPWMVEGMGERQMHVRYVGIHPTDWRDIFSEQNNLLIKFIIDRTSSYFEFYLANKPPFLRIITRNFSDGEKWEVFLGEIKRRLHKDKADVLTHNEKIGNLYVLLQSYLKDAE